MITRASWRVFSALLAFFIQGSASAQTPPPASPMVYVASASGNYCIDRYEASLDASSRAVSLPGVVPRTLISGTEAAATCAAAGKRLCTASEWLRACQGPSALTFPYGDTYQPGTCNDTGALKATGGSPGCVTAEGVFDMVGNVAEWIDDPAGTFNGGFYSDVSLNGPGCFYTTTAHDFGFAGQYLGFRCCAAPMGVDSCDPPPVPEELTANAGPDQNALTGVLVTLTGSASREVSAWTWSVVDAPPESGWGLDENSTSPAALFVAYTAGTYVLSLVVGDQNGGQSIPDLVTVTVSASPNQPPTAVIEGVTQYPDPAFYVCLDGMHSFDPEGETLAYAWDMGANGATVHEGLACHQYPAEGAYTVTLTVTDRVGASDTEVVVIQVRGSNSPPTASPTAAPTSGVAPLSVQFVANASDADNDALSYNWDFGDGAHSGDESPSHTYSSPGTYTVTLSISDGRIEEPVTVSMSIVVNPVLSFEVLGATLTWHTRWMGDVGLSAHLNAPLPGPNDTVAVSFDGVQLLAVPFSEFREPGGGGRYRYSHQGLLVLWDRVDETLTLSTPSKTTLTDVDTGNGVIMEVRIGDDAAIQTIQMREVRAGRFAFVQQ